MKLKKVRKLMNKFIDKHLVLGEDDYTFILTEFADGTYQLKFHHSFEEGHIEINTPFSVSNDVGMMVMDIFDKDHKPVFHYNTGIKLGKEIK